MKTLTLQVFCVLLLIQCSLQYVVDKASKADEELSWWQKSVFYQIYPQSFKDSDNDGTGDLQGIIQKMDHFTDLGVQAIWLSPIYESPMVDGGYDISNYRSINPIFGTLDDFLELVKEAHSRGLKVIMDYVPNHTSDKHEWFEKSVAREDGYEDYYVWNNGTIVNGTRQPPNNWVSVFGNSGWTWNEVRQQYYFHQFTVQQPDLNLRNTKVQQELKDVMKFWLDIGVDGFRADAVPHLVEDELLRDEPVANENLTATDYNYLDHIYTKDQNETFDVIYDWRDFLKNYSISAGEEKILMTEAATNFENVVLYYGTTDGSRRGAHFSFNFYFLGLREYSTPSNVKEIFDVWLGQLPSIYTPNFLTGNHDNPRAATRYGTRNIDAYNMLLMYLKAVAITYMAEEIGQENGEVTCEEGKDPSAIGNCTTFDQVSRDFARTPFQWDNTTNAGFNQGTKTWLPVSKKYLETNLANQKSVSKSHYTVYKQATKYHADIAARPYEDFDVRETTEGVLELVRYYGGSASDVFVFNMNNVTVQAQITGKYISDELDVLISNVNSLYDTGDVVKAENISLNAGDTIILRTKSA